MARLFLCSVTAFCTEDEQKHSPHLPRMRNTAIMAEPRMSWGSTVPWPLLRERGQRPRMSCPEGRPSMAAVPMWPSFPMWYELACRHAGMANVCSPILMLDMKQKLSFMPPRGTVSIQKSAGEIPEELPSSVWHRVTCSLKETPLEGQTAGSIELCSILLLSKQPYI